MHLFIHTLYFIPRNWYALVELQRITTNWDELANDFQHTFSYVDDNPMIDVALQVIKDNIIEYISFLVSIIPQRNLAV